jgi:5,10-methylenetetrahydromethanopterin reductase
MSVSFHVGCLPNRPLLDSVEMGCAAERLGYAGMWVADSHSVMRDAYSVLTVLATRTSTLQLATGVTLTGTRHPAVLANSWATLDELSSGRAVCGIGVGESAVYNLGMKPERLAVFEEKLKVIRGLLKGEKVTYQGTEIQMPWANCEVPLIVTSSGPKSLQMAGRIGDGVLFQVGAQPGMVDYALDNIRLGAESVGRKLSDLKLYMRIATSVHDDREVAMQELKGYTSVAAGTVFKTVPREYLDDELYEDLARFKAGYDYAEHGSNQSGHSDLLTERIFDAVAVACPPAEAVSRFRALAAKGLDGFVCPFGMPQPIPYMETFAEQVIPQLVDSGGNLREEQ